MERRQFVKNAVVTVGALASGLGLDPGSAAEQAATGQPSTKSGRLVRAVSIGFKLGLPLAKITDLVDREGAQGTDIITLPEICRGQNDRSQETLDGPTISTMAHLARKHRTYIVCPIDRKDGNLRFNSAVLLDRRGQVVCVYDKFYPVWQNEILRRDPPVHPGEVVRVYSTDFGRVGLAICFDVNWTPLWQQMSNQGAELVIWPSAYSAGRSLQAQAIQYNYYVMSSTLVPDCLVYDIDGELLAHNHENAGNGINVTRITLDLDRCIFHLDLNGSKRDELLKNHGDDVEQEKWLPMEGWFVLRAKRSGVSARALARQYGLEELRHYINRSRCEIDKCRGWEFS